MKKMLAVLTVAAAVLLCSNNPASALVDVKQFPTGYFVPNEASTYNDPYYRWYNEDWGWQHSAISGTFSTASLFISAWDVDLSSGEIDNIYAFDGADKILLGRLDGKNDAWGYTTFSLDLSRFADDIASGLKVFIDIDSTHTYQYWAVALAKSVLTLDGGSIPNPEPNPVPEPSTMLLLGAGLAGLGLFRKRLTKR